jgi:hypothetical protein
MKTVVLLVIMATAAWGQRTQTCKACPSVADMNEQFLRRTPRPPKPEQAREQRQAKPRLAKGKNHSKGTQRKNADHNGSENR